MRAKWSYIVIFMLLGHCGWAYADDLMSVYRLAMEHDPGIAQARATMLAYTESPAQARALLMPQLSATGGGGRQLGTTVPQQFGDYADWSASLSQTLFNYDLIVGLSNAKLESQYYQLAYVAAQQNLMVTVATQYFALLDAVQTYKLQTESQMYYERTYKQALVSLKAGLATRTDVNDAKAQYDLTLAQALQAKNDVANSQVALEQLTGSLSSVLHDLDDVLVIVHPEPPDVNRWAERASTQQYTVKQSAILAHQAELAVKTAFGGHLPVLTANGELSRTVVRKAGATMGKSIGLEMSLPIYSGGGVSAATRQARHQYQAAQDALRQAKLVAVANTKVAYLGVDSSIARVKALRQAVIAGMMALQSEQAGYKVGKRTLLDVLNRQVSLTKQKQLFIQARHAYFVQLLSLKQSISTLSDKDMQMVNEFLVHQVSV